jgi:two-component system LytT family response regulator
VSSKNIRALIVDDEPLARERLRTLLAGVVDIEIAGEFADGRSAVKGIRELEPDLIFLDVQMPEIDGFGVLHAVGAEHMPATVFVTAYDQYALKAFDVSAVDYLLKPFDRARFLRALGRAKNQISLGRSGQSQDSSDLSNRLLTLLQHVRPDHVYLERLVIKSAGHVFFLKTDEVDWIEAAGNYVRLHVARESHMLRETMNALEAKLDPRKFVRIHRSTIVNLERIKQLHPLFHGDHIVILRDGHRLTLSRGYRENLERVLGKAI